MSEARSPSGPGAGDVQPTPEELECTFEQLMAKLEATTEALATGELGIEAAADLSEKAERLHALASARLVQVEQRVHGVEAPGRGSRPGT